MALTAPHKQFPPSSFKHQFIIGAIERLCASDFRYAYIKCVENLWLFSKHSFLDFENPSSYQLRLNSKLLFQKNCKVVSDCLSLALHKICWGKVFEDLRVQNRIKKERLLIVLQATAKIVRGLQPRFYDAAKNTKNPEDKTYFEPYLEMASKYQNWYAKAVEKSKNPTLFQYLLRYLELDIVLHEHPEFSLNYLGDRKITEINSEPEHHSIRSFTNKI